jgi:hypothetical protein
VGTKRPTIHRLRQLVQEASRENPHLTSRLERAAFLAVLRSIVKVGDSHYRVASEDGLRYYSVIDGHCECSDYLRHGSGHPCKHRLALGLLHRLGCTGFTGAGSHEALPLAGSSSAYHPN